VTTVPRSTERVRPASSSPQPLPTDPLSRCLSAALDAADAADILGLDSQPLRDAQEAGIRRVGFAGDGARALSGRSS
jgi:hypothetical protein